MSKTILQLIRIIQGYQQYANKLSCSVSGGNCPGLVACTPVGGALRSVATGTSTVDQLLNVAAAASAPQLHSHPTVYSGSSLRSTMRPTRGSASSEISVECCVEAVM